MTFEQLECFIAAVKYNTFLEAAEALHISQSTLSKKIHNLEKEINLELFNREKRRAALTEGGKLFYLEAQRLLGAYKQAMLNIDNFIKAQKPKLRIAALPILSQYNILSLLKDFSDSYPEISLCIEERDEMELLDGLYQNRSDLIVVRKNMLDMEKFDFYPLATDRLVILLPSTHRLACNNSIRLKDIAHEKFILMQANTSLYKLCMKLFEKEDIIPDILRTERLETIIGDVAINNGISISAEENIKMFHNPDIVAVPLEPAIELYIGIACIKGKKLKGAAAIFLKYIQNINQ